MRLVFCLFPACHKQVWVLSAIETEPDTWIGEEKERGQQKKVWDIISLGFRFLIITGLIKAIWQTGTILLDESFQGPILCIQNKRFNVTSRDLAGKLLNLVIRLSLCMKWSIDQCLRAKSVESNNESIVRYHK